MTGQALHAWLKRALKRAIALVGLAGVLALGCLAGAQASGPDAETLEALGRIEHFSCTAPGGQPVAIHQDARVNTIASAAWQPGAGYVIEYNQQALLRYHPITALFLLEHECAHHWRGDTDPATPPPSAERRREIELAADCDASKTLSKTFAPWNTPDTWAILGHDLRNLAGDKTYLDGADRVAFMKAYCTAQ